MAKRYAKEALTDFKAGLAAFGRGFGALGRTVPRGRWLRRLVYRPTGVVLSSAMTLVIPLLALNGEMARSLFPASDTDLQAAGRNPNITILASDGTRLGARGSDLGEAVSLDELPSFVTDSFLATEDRRFFEHPGFDPSAMIRAAVRNWQAGNVVQGGSTITQQLVKNLFLSGEQSFERKFEELHLAFWLEARLSKEQILELYLNRIYLGANTYGLSAASEAYFSKKPQELTLAEAAILAGLPKAPSQLAPSSNYEGALARSHEVIGNLVEAGKIDDLTAKMAVMFPPPLALRNAHDADGHFLDHVAAELKRLLPDLERDVVVRTTLHPESQRAAEAAVTAELGAEIAGTKGAEEAALVAFDRTGGIVAMIGGRSYRDSQFNRATQARRQPGSAFKPFIFLAALEAGFDQDTVLIDRPLQVDGWQPTNYKERFIGPHRMREALARSSNTSTVQVTEAVGRDEVIATARRMGLTSRMAPHPSLALGSFEVTPFELTKAYMPFAHGGFAPEPHVILEVRDRLGRELYTHKHEAPPQVVSARSAAQMTDLLHSVTENGTGRAARIEGHEVAGKTGTTNGWRDAWFVGYSAHMTAGVWVGNDENREMDDVSGATYPARIWQAFMATAHEAQALEPLPLGETYEAYDPQLWDLSATYAALKNDLTGHAYGSRRYRSPGLFDSIRNILSRENREPPARSDQVEGEVVTGDAQIRRAPGRPAPLGGEQVTGRVVPPEENGGR